MASVDIHFRLFVVFDENRADVFLRHCVLARVGYFDTRTVGQALPASRQFRYAYVVDLQSATLLDRATQGSRRGNANATLTHS